MGRALRKEYTNSITVHYYNDKGRLGTTTLAQQVGFNKYKTKANVIVRLVDRDEAVANKEPGTGYVVITDATDHSTHYMRKLTKNVIECFDGARYHFDYVLVEEDGVVTGIKLASNAPASIEGVEADES